MSKMKNRFSIAIIIFSLLSFIILSSFLPIDMDKKYYDKTVDDGNIAMQIKLIDRIYPNGNSEEVYEIKIEKISNNDVYLEELMTSKSKPIYLSMNLTESVTEYTHSDEADYYNLRYRVGDSQESSYLMTNLDRKFDLRQKLFWGIILLSILLLIFPIATFSFRAALGLTLQISYVLHVYERFSILGIIAFSLLCVIFGSIHRKDSIYSYASMIYGFLVLFLPVLLLLGFLGSFSLGIFSLFF